MSLDFNPYRSLVPLPRYLYMYIITHEDTCLSIPICPPAWPQHPPTVGHHFLALHLSQGTQGGTIQGMLGSLVTTWCCFTTFLVRFYMVFNSYTCCLCLSVSRTCCICLADFDVLRPGELKLRIMRFPRPCLFTRFFLGCFSALLIHIHIYL